MRAILIDPFARSVAEADYSGDWKTIAPTIQCGGSPFTLLTINPERDALYLDDEGLFKQGQKFFSFGSYPTPLGGRALLLGHDAEGETTACSVSLDEIQPLVKWLSLKFVGVTQSEGIIQHPVLGTMTVLKQEPKFLETKDIN